MITAEQYADLAAANAAACRRQCEQEDAELAETGRVLRDEPEPVEHDPRVQHRSTGWQRWRGWCPCGASSPWGNQADAGEWVADHADDHPPPPDCSCWNAEHLEHEPRDCPLHKEPRSND